MGPQDLGAPDSGQPLSAASWCRLVLCSCHGMQGTLRAPFACYFFYPKGSSGCFPEQQESRLVFPVLPGRAGRAVPEPGRRAEHPAKPQPLRWALHGAAQRSLIRGLQRAVPQPGRATGFVYVTLMSVFGNRTSEIIFYEAGKAVDCGLSGNKGPSHILQPFGRV